MRAGCCPVPRPQAGGWSIGPCLGMAIVVFCFPDTHGLELEETSGELLAAAALEQVAVRVAPLPPA